MSIDTISRTELLMLLENKELKDQFGNELKHVRYAEGFNSCLRRVRNTIIKMKPAIEGGTSNESHHC